MVAWASGKRGRYIGVASLVGLLLGLTIGYEALELRQEMKRSAARGVAYASALRLSQRVQEAVGPAYMLAALVQRGNGQVDQFEAVATDLLQQFPMARAVELAPGGVITQVYPLPGNEGIIGHDLLRDKARNREAHLAVARKQLTLAGPFELKQGGLGAVGRFPVFQYTPDGRQEFWGFTIVLLRVPELLAAAGFVQLTGEGYGFELCRVPPDEEQCTPFYRQGSGTLDDPVRVTVDVPNGRWTLSLAPDGGWSSPWDWSGVLLHGVGLAALLGALQALLLRSLFPRRRAADHREERAGSEVGPLSR